MACSANLPARISRSKPASPSTSANWIGSRFATDGSSGKSVFPIEPVASFSRATAELLARGWGLRYPLLFPNDITYTIGKSDYRKDWFFQHVPHAEADATAIAAASRGFRPPGITGRATPYTIQFVMESEPKGKATLCCLRRHGYRID